MRVLVLGLLSSLVGVVCAGCSCGGGGCGMFDFDLAAKAGDPCTVGGCGASCGAGLKCCFTSKDSGSVCVSEGATCAPAGAGQGCSSDQPCRAPLSCLMGSCSCRPSCSSGVTACISDEDTCSYGCCTGQQQCVDKACVARPDAGTPDAGKPDTRPAFVDTTTWVRVQRAHFRMGAPHSDVCRAPDPTESWHEVTLTHDFEIGALEVTQLQYQTVMGPRWKGFPACGSSCPMESISWHEAAAYCNALSEARGLGACYDCDGATCHVASAYGVAPWQRSLYDCPGFRLPTEAEWELAYRAGTASSLYSGTPKSCVSDAAADGIAWYSANAGKTPHPVGKKAPNALGVYDMAGNVAEWVDDAWSQAAGKPVVDPWGDDGDTAVVRGGGWASVVTELRASARSPLAKVTTWAMVGFRCARSYSN